MPLFPRALLPVLIALVLTAMTLAVFWPVRDHRFIELDDGAYLLESPHVSEGLTPGGVSWAFTTNYFTYWHPLTWISHMAAVDVYGMDPGGHHRVNLYLHLLNGVLLFLVLLRMTGRAWASGFVAALFAVHPLHVEPVAWVAARTDVLGTSFWILTMGAYTRYVDRPRAGTYLLLVGSFVLGLMAKPMQVTLPFALLLLDYWPLGRFVPADPRTEPPVRRAQVPLRDLLLEKIPLFALAAASVLVTYITAFHAGSIRTQEEIPFGIRAANAVVTYAAYLAKTVWPSSLSIFYPYPPGFPAWWKVAGSVLLLSAVSTLVFRAWKKSPCLPVGWLWYLGTLVPVIGWVQIGDQAAADRYTYVPLIGIFLMVAWGIPEAVREVRFRSPALGIPAILVVAAFAVTSRCQVMHWRDSVTVFRHAIEAAPDNWMAHYNLGSYLVRLGKFGEAIPHFREAARIRPFDAWACNNLGGALKESGRIDEAVPWFEKALRLQPDHPFAHYNLGNILILRGDLEGGIYHFRETLRVNPGDASARRSLEWAMRRRGGTAPGKGPAPPGSGR